jgi:DNA repair ATPase RecN
MSDKRAKIAKQLLDKGETELAREVLALGSSKEANPLYTEVVTLLDKAAISTKEASRALYDVLKTSWALAPGTEQEDKEPIMELAVALQKHAKQIDEIGAAIRPLADPPYAPPSKEWDRSRRPS